MAALIPALVALLMKGRGGGGGGRSGGPKKDPNEAYWEKSFTNHNALNNSDEAMKILSNFNTTGGYEGARKSRGESYASGTIKGR